MTFTEVIGAKERRLRLTIFIASAAAYCISNIGWWVQPAMLSEVMTSFGAGATRASIITSAELAAMTLSTFVLARFSSRVSFARLLGLGAVVIIAGQGASVFAPNFNWLLAARVIAGAGEGAALMTANAALAGFPDADRAYGQLNVLNIAIGAAVIFCLPGFGQLLGKFPVFPAILTVTLILAPLLAFMPRSLVATHVNNAGVVAESAAGPSVPGFVALVAATLLVGTGSGAVWAFLFEIGKQTALVPAELDHILSISILCGLAGSGIAALLGGRFGRLVPFIGSLIVGAIANSAITMTHGAVLFQVAACANVACIYLALPYLLGYAAAIDRSGRYAAGVGGAFLFTGATGPILGGQLIEWEGFKALSVAVVVFDVLALLLVLYVESLLRPNAVLRAAARAAGPPDIQTSANGPTL